VIALTPQLRVLVAVTPADFRCGIDGLARRVRQALADDPFGGAVFVFRNRRGTAIKLLAYDGQGFWRIFQLPFSQCFEINRGLLNLGH
jgi:transposase